MSLLNLSLPEFVAVLSTVSAVLVTLYLLDRSRRRQVVATLRFWKPAEDATTMRQKRRIQQPWSLLLQLLSVALLLLALAQLQWGDPERNIRDHVVILDTSAWMSARNGNGTLMDEARTSAITYVRRLPAADRIMLVRADGLATPVTSLETNRAKVEQAIRETKPSSAALNLEQAIEFAERVQKLHSKRPGEIAYFGAGRLANSDTDVNTPANLRVIPVASPAENLGLRKIGLRRSDPDHWQIYVSAKNYGAQLRTTQIGMQFAGAPLGIRTVTLAPGAEQQAVFTLQTRAAGWLEARIMSSDPFPDDDRAMLEIPAQRSLTIVAYTDNPDGLRPIVSASANVAPVFRSPSAYDQKVKADVVLLDGFVPPAPPPVPSIWIDPSGQRSPVRIRSVLHQTKLTTWNSKHELGTGLRTRDVVLETTSVFSPGENDIPIASVDAGPVILARPQTASSPKMVLIGFHPGKSGMRYELATPLLFANILRWMEPAVFQQWELNAGTVGSVEARVANDATADDLRVTSDASTSVPYTVQNGRLRFFAGSPGNYRVQAGDREMAYSLTLPELGDVRWDIPARVRKGVPRTMQASASVMDLWPWLALLGAAGLLIEWIYFGRGRREASIARRRVQARAKVLQKKAS